LELQEQRRLDEWHKRSPAGEHAPVRQLSRECAVFVGVDPQHAQAHQVRRLFGQRGLALIEPSGMGFARLIAPEHDDGQGR